MNQFKYLLLVFFLRCSQPCQSLVSNTIFQQRQIARHHNVPARIFTSRLCSNKNSMSSNQPLAANSSFPSTLNILDSTNLIPPQLLRRCKSLEEVQSIASDLIQWRQSLKKGYLPDRPTGSPPIWPYEPLFSEILSTFSKHKIPQLVNKHKELLEPLMTALIDLGLNFTRQSEEEPSASSEESKQGGTIQENSVDESSAGEDSKENQTSNSESKKEKAKALMRGFDKRWEPVLDGVSSLDELLGPGSKVLSKLMGEGAEDSDEDDDGVGLFDGLWRRSGWSRMKDLQERVGAMDELKDMIHKLGRRPSARGTFKTRHPRMVSSKIGPMGVAKNPLLAADMEGLHFSADINKMTFRDASLLKGSPALRRLFLSRFTGRSLLTYEYTDWLDEPSRRARSTYRINLPTVAGGPIIVCIDTSGSMAGSRETLAKAVVLECVAVAHRAKRDCYVLAFSGQRNLAECSLKMSIDKSGLDTLMGFLEYSFSGGTDVVAPFQRAMELMKEDDWAGSDILLVTDGELCDPPLDEETNRMLRQMNNEKNLRVHGLLVGASSSVPLSRICENEDGENRVYNFLNNYDELAAFSSRFKVQSKSPSRLYSQTESSCRGWRRKQPRKVSTRLFATIEDFSFSSRWSEVVASAVADAKKVALCNFQSANYDYQSGLMLRDSVERIISSLGSGLIERDTEVRLLLLAVLSREHILLLGPPGTGKSELARRLCYLNDGLFFERLLTRYTQPEELFGPFSLKALEQDKYTRSIQGFLPTASTAFIDEVFKANSAILNTLLTVLNERMFDNGDERIRVPLMALIGASNELPDTDELDALYDRFIFRKIVQPISDDNLFKLLEQKYLFDDDTFKRDLLDGIDFASLSSECADRSANVTVPTAVMDIVVRCRAFLRDKVKPPVYCSDRRLKKAMHVMRTAAAAQGRTYVSLTDTLLLQHILWSKPGDDLTLREWLYSQIFPKGNDHRLRRALQYFLEDAYDSLRNDDSKGVEKALQFLKKFIDPIASKAAIFEAIKAEFDDNVMGGNVWIEAIDMIALKQQIDSIANVASTRYNSLLTRVIERCELLSEYLNSTISQDYAISMVENIFVQQEEDNYTILSDRLKENLKEAKRTFANEILQSLLYACPI